MSVVEEERTCILGGQQSHRSILGAYSLGQAAVIGAWVLVWIVVLLFSRSIWTIAALLIGGLVLALVIRRDPDTHEFIASRVAERVWFWWRGRRGADVWRPAEGEVPPEYRGLRELGWSDTEGPARIGLLHKASPDGRFGDRSHLIAVVELVGGGDGLRPVAVTNAQGRRFGDLLAELGARSLPVDQIDFATSVTPADPDLFRLLMEDQIAPGCPPELRESMEELASFSATTIETHRTFASIRMPLQEVQARVTGVADEEATVLAALEVLRDVVSRLERAGMRVQSVGTPRSIAAATRALYDPSFRPDDVDGIEGMPDAFRAGYQSHREGLCVEAADGGEWWHAVASIPIDAWPAGPVGVRWLESLVTDITPAMVRTIKAQHRLIPKRQARGRARAAATYDSATIRAARSKDQVSTGVDEAQQGAAMRVLDDLLGRAAGDVPAVRVLISARTLAELRTARNRVEQAASDGHIERLHWHDRRHHQAMVLLAPLCQGVQA